jgi:putative transposase
MRKTFRFRLFPTKAQCTALQHQLDACRWIYNKTLECRRDAWEERKESLSRYDTNKFLTQWKQDEAWLQAGHAQAMQEAQTRVDLAFRAFFRRIKAGGEAPGYPRFKPSQRYNSFTYPQEKGNWRVLGNDCLHLSKIGNVKVKLHRPVEGQPKTLTIRRDAVGKWYACFSCVATPKPLPPTNDVAGVDVGLTHFATLSNGEKIDNPRFFRKGEKALAKAQRKLSKIEKGTAKRRKYVLAVQHIHQHIANQRLDFAHQLSRQLINRFQLLAFEKLSITEMQNGNHRGLNKSIADAAWRQFIQTCVSKAESADRTVVLVEPRGTTQGCSGCGKVVPKLLSQRTHSCPHCGLEMDRDINASLNILARGLASVGWNP